MDEPTSGIRRYGKDEVCGFRYTNAPWGEFSDFYPLKMPIVAGPLRFTTSEALYQAAKFARNPGVQRSIAQAPTARAAKRIGRSPAHRVSPGWDAQRVNVMRWVLRMQREADPERIDAALEASGVRPIVEVSTLDVWWGARPFPDHYEGRNVLGCLWIELREQLRGNHPLATANRGTRRRARGLRRHPLHTDTTGFKQPSRRPP